MGHTQGIGSLVAKSAEGMQIFFLMVGAGEVAYSAVQKGIGGGAKKKMKLFFLHYV